MGIQEYTKIFCRNIHWLREKAGLSNLELSQRSGVSLEMLEALEEEMLPEEMMMDDAFALADALTCKVTELFQ